MNRSPVNRYVAIGDSQTEGLLDPDGAGGFRGWADRFADLLVVDHPHLRYANLAVRGRLIGAVRAEQLSPALAMRPDVATVMAGLNDMLRPSLDLAGVLADLDAMIAALVDSGATVLTNTYPDVGAIAPLFRRARPRFAAFNDGIREVAARHGALVVDFDRVGVGNDLRLWSPDRLHLNPVGHALTAAAFAEVLGVAGFDGWRQPLPVVAPSTLVRTVGAEARWVGTTMLPWLGRRLAHRSSGDGRSAKRPSLLPVASLFHIVEPGDWPASGAYRPPSLAASGFVHLSFADQVERPANALYADVDALEVVELDPTALGVPVIVEDSYGEGVEFPHAYGPLPASSAVAVHPMSRDGAGRWRFEHVR